MPGGRRGLVAPQNTFLDTLIKRAGAQPDTSFLLANAQIVDFPIVYCSDEFSKQLGYPRSEVMQKPARCEFMVGALTDRDSLVQVSNCMSASAGGCFEVLFYRKTGHGVWIQLHVTAIRNEQRVVVLFLLTFRDITAFKEPLEGVVGSTMAGGGLSKFAKLAWTMTRSRNVNGSRSPYNLVGSGSGFSFGAGTGMAATAYSPTALGPNSLAGPSTSLVSRSPSQQKAAEQQLLTRPMLVDSLPEYKHDPPRTPPHILLHYSPFKVAWDWIILGLTFYTVIVVPYNLAITKSVSNSNVTLFVVDSIVDVIFFIDIIFNFHTTFVGNDGAVIVDEIRIRQNYLRSGFVIDVMACLPYDAINMFDTSSAAAPPLPLTAASAAATAPMSSEAFLSAAAAAAAAQNSKGYGNIFSILKVMRLFRLGRVARALHRFLESSFALLLLMLSFYMIVAHWFACVWYVIGREDLKSGVQLGWLSALANSTGQPFVLIAESSLANVTRGWDNATIGDLSGVLILGGPPEQSMYVTALYFTMTCMTSIGFGNVAAETDMEKSFCVAMMMVSSLLYAAIFGHVTTIIHNMTLATAKYHEMLNSVKEFMILNDVPRTLCERVLDYVVSKWANTKGVDQSKVLGVCPKDMRADICVHLNRQVFNGCPAFRLASDGCLRALAVNFEMIHSAPGDFIVRKGEEIRELCFVVSGSLEVIQDGEILAFLSRGDVFGDSQWKDHTLAKSAVHVRALTYCDIHTISVEKLKEVLEFYKAFAQTFARNLTLTYDLAKRNVFYKVSDRKLERVLNEVQLYEPPFTPAQILLLKRAVNKFKGQISDGLSSSTENPLRYNSSSPNTLRERMAATRTIAARSSVPLATSAPNGPPAPAHKGPPLQEVAQEQRAHLQVSHSEPIIRGATAPSVVSAGSSVAAAAAAYGAAGASRSKVPPVKRAHVTANRWKFVRQKSQQMLTALAPTATTATTAPAATPASSSTRGSSAGTELAEASLCESAGPTVLSTTAAASIMHDFNQSMSEYRREMRGSIAHLDDKINRLESAVLNLVERLPQLLQQPQQQAQLQQDQQQPTDEEAQQTT